MTPFNNATPSEPSPAVASGNPLPKLSQRRLVADTNSMTSSLPSLPDRNLSPSMNTTTLSVSTSTPPGSRSISPNGGSGPLKTLSSSVFAGTFSRDSQDASVTQNTEDPRRLILQAYVPHIAVYTSADTDELINDKGFSQGLWQILRPYGEHVQGKVTIRDSNGASRVCDDFAVRFVQLGDGLEKPVKVGQFRASSERPDVVLNGASLPQTLHASNTTQRSRTGGDIEAIENVVERHLTYAEESPKAPGNDDLDSSRINNLSPFYALYFRKVLSGLPLAPHETFSHPVACIMAISSRNLSPIEALRHLYDESSRGAKRLPLWVNSEYLRYYILVHDEERDDISKSMSLFEQMKRHFGLHCHLLRLRSSQCLPTDDDSVQLPLSEWTSASEELAEIDTRDSKEDVDDTALCIFESDVTAIKSFIREMVTQSVVPSMERCISTWNDQVASRRRGFSGKVFSITKRWTGIGSSSRSSSTATYVNAAGANSNYDTSQGFYRPDAPEAVMRKLADYAFMLRDWKLAYSIYDLVRTDFSTDKAWEYHAAANEMTAVSTLLLPQANKSRSETVDQTLEIAVYSYMTRCADSYGALRSLMLGVELLRLKGGSYTDDAARWGARLLESKIVRSVGDALVKERIAVCYVNRKGTGSGAWGSRMRKAALWNILAADDWLTLGKYIQAERRLADVRMLYGHLSNRESLTLFLAANTFLQGLEKEIYVALLSTADGDGQELMGDDGASSMDEESEALDIRSHRKSLIGTTAPPLASIETAPLRALTLSTEVDITRDDDFE